MRHETSWTCSRHNSPVTTIREEWVQIMGYVQVYKAVAMIPKCHVCNQPMKNNIECRDHI